jgi:ATP-dependent protease HslVU (ClpYQ) peptidase subunit
MTTIAFDGHFLVADTLNIDGYGLPDYADKLYIGKDFLMGGAGQRHEIQKWWKVVKDMPLSEVLEYGYPCYDKDANDQAIMLVCRVSRVAYKLGGSSFTKCSRNYHAVGSGRDYAIAAMYLGKTARQAVEIARIFDVYTGGPLQVMDVDNV